MKHNVDNWATEFFKLMLTEKLSVELFEESIQQHLRTRKFIFSAPQSADWILKFVNSLNSNHDAGYGEKNTSQDLKFRSTWLVGKNGIPGAVHINAPPEKISYSKFYELNRPLHRHDTGRIGLITSGEAIFHFIAINTNGTLFAVNCPVKSGDIIFWPAWTPHTFNAMNGFSLLSAMAAYVSPREDGFVYELDRNMPAPDSLQKINIDRFLKEKMLIACGI